MHLDAIPPPIDLPSAAACPRPILKAQAGGELNDSPEPRILPWPEYEIKYRGKALLLLNTTNSFVPAAHKNQNVSLSA